MLGLTRHDGGTTLARTPSSGTTIGRWDPWSEFSRLRSEMDTLFDRFFGETPRLIQGIGTFTPAVDLYETPEELVLSAYLPGMSREDIHLEVVGDTLHLWGERKPITPEKDVTIHLAQGVSGQFDFRCGLPVEVKPDAVKAVYRDGVLEVRLPKAESAKPKPVEIRIQG